MKLFESLFSLTLILRMICQHNEASPIMVRNNAQSVQAAPIIARNDVPGHRGFGGQTIDKVLARVNRFKSHGNKPGDYLTELDIMNLANTNRRTKRAAALVDRWTGGIIPYTFRPDFDVTNQQFQTAFEEAKLQFHTLTCLRLVPHTDESHKIVIIPSDGCWSYIGRLYTDQNLGLAAGCWYGGIIAHEFIHAAGFHHEQSRVDRDNYVTIMLDNIEDGKEGNFEKLSSMLDLGSPYEHESVMHYGTYYFSKNGLPTIVTNDPTKQDLIGNRESMTAEDANQLNSMYEDLCGGSTVEPSTDTTDGVSTLEPSTYSTDGKPDKTDNPNKPDKTDNPNKPDKTDNPNKPENPPKKDEVREVSTTSTVASGKGSVNFVFNFWNYICGKQCDE